MPMPNDPATNERIEGIVLGIAAQIQGGMADVKSEVIGLITEDKLRWQAQMESRLEDRGMTDPSASLSDFRAKLTRSQIEVDDKLRAQDAELQQLQQGLKDLETQARRAATTTTQQLEQRTEVILDTMASHFDTVFDEVKAAVEPLDWRVSVQANEIWSLTQNQPGSVGELVADIEGRLQRQTGNNGSNPGTKKVRVRI